MAGMCLSASSNIKAESLLSRYQLNISTTLTTTSSVIPQLPGNLRKQDDATIHNVISPQHTRSSKLKQKQSLKSESKQETLKQKLHKTNRKLFKKKHIGNVVPSKKLATSVNLDRDAILAMHSVSKPNTYDIGRHVKVTELKLPKFLPPEKDPTILQLQRPMHDVLAIKVRMFEKSQTV